MRPARWVPGRGQAGAAAASAAAAAKSSPAYCVVYASDDSLSDGELHLERRAGSLSAWYQRGGGGGSQTGRRSRQPSAGPGDSSDAGDVAPRKQSFTVVLHDEAAGGGDADEEQEAEDQERASGGGVTWERNTLFGGGAADGDASEPGSSEELAARSATLRQLLRERDGEVQALQRLLDERQSQLEGRAAGEEAQARRVAALEERIRLLTRQLEAAGHEVEGPLAAGNGRLGASFSTGKAGFLPHSPMSPAFQQQPPAVQKQALAAQYQRQADADAHYVQLPAQSYVEHSGCGFWSGLVEGAQRHPRRLAAVAAGLALLLVVVLCAALIPAAARRRSAPAFAAVPALAATGATWADVTVQLDRPGLVSWMVVRQADLNLAVAGTGRTLLELLQAEQIDGSAVVAASAPGSSLAPPPGGTLEAGLQGLAVACGWAPVPQAATDARASVVSVASSAAAACAEGGTAAGGARCARCPRLQDGTAYTLVLAPATAGGRAGRGVAVLNAVTGNAAVNVNSLEPPFADNATAAGVTLHAKLNSPGTLYWAIAHDTLYAPWGAAQLAFRALPPPSSAVLAADPAAFVGGLVANGSIAVPEAGAWVAAHVEPPCVGALCERSLRGLQGGTAYRAFLVAVDAFGNADPAPAAAPFTTAPWTAAPALLPATGPANVSAGSFGMTVAADAAGAAYYLLVAAKGGGGSGSGADDGGVAPGQWARVDSLPRPGGRRLAAEAGAGDGGQTGAGPSLPWSTPRRRLAEPAAAAAAVAPGSLVQPVCYPANRTCSLAPGAAFAAVPGLAAGYDVVASGCVVLPAAGRPLELPPFTGLQNNTLYHVLLSTEDEGVPTPARLAPPAVYAVRTVDLSAPQLACGFPAVTNITAAGFSLAALLTKPGATVRFVVLPSAAAEAHPPSALEVLQGTGGGGVAPAAAGALARQGWLPWEAEPAAGAGDERKSWAPVRGLQGGANYTAFLAVTADGATPAHGNAVVSVTGVLTPAVAPPAFTRLDALNTTIDEQQGTFSAGITAGLDRPGQVFYAVYRNYSCITGEPSVADVVAGAALPPAVCGCADRSYCALVAAGSFGVPAQALNATHAIGGDVSPLPFESLRGAGDDELKCFLGGLGEASDTFNIYLVAGNALPTHTGLAPHCSSTAQAEAAAAAAASGAPVESTCPAPRQLACGQAQQRPDSQTLQAGAFANWAAQDAGSDPLVWQPPPLGGAAGRPARVQLTLEGGTPPAIVWGPEFPADLRTPSSFGISFRLDKPAVLIYAGTLFRPQEFQSGFPAPPVLIATGRVPVFDAAATASSGAISACSWAPGGPMVPGERYMLQYVARDKFGRMDGLCTPGADPGACLQLTPALQRAGTETGLER